MYQHQNLVPLPEDAAAELPRRFETSQALVLVPFALAVGLLVAGGFLFVEWSKGGLPGKSGMLPFLFLPCGVVSLGIGFWNLLWPKWIAVGPDGFEGPDGFVRWEEVESVAEQVADLYAGMVKLRIWIRSAGRTVAFSHWQVGELDRLLAVVHEHTAPRLLAETRAALGRGETTDFGPIGVTPAGLAIDGRTVPWADVDSVWPDEAGDVGVWVHGANRPVLDVEAGKVGNLRVLLQLVEEMKPNLAAV